MLDVVTSWKPHFPVNWRLFVKERNTNIGNALDFYVVLGYLGNSQLCIVGRLAVGGSVTFFLFVLVKGDR